MKIFEFDMELSKKYAFDSKLAKDWSKIIYYTGTHDNATLLEWCQSLSPAAYRKLKKFLKKQGIKDGNISKRAIEFILKSETEYAIIDLIRFRSVMGHRSEEVDDSIFSLTFEYKFYSSF